MNVPVSEIYKDKTRVGQETENWQALVGFPISVEPDDNHPEHLQAIKMFFSMLDEFEGTITPQANEALAMHAQEHLQMVEQQSQGAMNIENIVGEQGDNQFNQGEQIANQSMGGGFAGVSEGVQNTGGL